MLAIGLAFLLFWLLFSVFTLTLVHAALITGVVFVAAGLLMGERKL